MKSKKEILAEEILHLLEESKAETDALKKLISALMEEELRKKSMSNLSDGSSNNKTI